MVLVSVGLTIEYTDLHNSVLIFPITAAILSIFPALVKVYRSRSLATNTGLHNSIMADLHNTVMAVQETR